MSNKAPYEILRQKDLMMIALETHNGNVKKAAKQAGISARTHYRWRQEDADYERKTDVIKDICYRDIKEEIIDLAMKRAAKGDQYVLNQLMRIFLKKLPEEMQLLNRANNVPLRVNIKYVKTRQEAGELMKQSGELPPDAEW